MVHINAGSYDSPITTLSDRILSSEFSSTEEFFIVEMDDGVSDFIDVNACFFWMEARRPVRGGVLRLKKSNCQCMFSGKF